MAILVAILILLLLVILIQKFCEFILHAMVTAKDFLFMFLQIVPEEKYQGTDT